MKLLKALTTVASFAAIVRTQDASCMCDKTAFACDANCCCDADCSPETVQMVFTGCQKETWGHKKAVRCVDKSDIPPGLEPRYVLARAGILSAEDAVRADIVAREGEFARFPEAAEFAIFCVVHDNSDLDDNSYPPAEGTTWTDLQKAADDSPGQAVYWGQTGSGGWTRRETTGTAGFMADAASRTLPGPPHWYRAGEPVGALRFWPPDEVSAFPVGLPSPRNVYGRCDPMAPGRFLVQDTEPPECLHSGRLEELCEGGGLDATGWPFVAVTPSVDATMSDADVRTLSWAATVSITTEAGATLAEEFNAQAVLAGTTEVSPPVRTYATPVLADGSECFDAGFSLGGGAVIEETRVPGAMACQRRCVAHVSCAAWVHARGRCTLRIRFGNERPTAPGAVAGPRSCSLPPAGCVRANATLVGGRIGELPAGNVIICQALCRERVGCLSWVLLDGTCSLRDVDPSAEGYERTGDASLAGPAECAPPPEEVTPAPPPPGTDVAACWEKDVDYPGADLGTGAGTPALSPEVCQIVCQQIPDCEAFVHHAGVCYPKAAVPSTREPRPGATAGPKVCIDARPLTAAPTRSPQGSPTASPSTLSPTRSPTRSPLVPPTGSPLPGNDTHPPSLATPPPTAAPSGSPREAVVTVEPSSSPSNAPSLGAKAPPTRAPVLSPTASPTQSTEPSRAWGDSTEAVRCRNALRATSTRLEYSVSYFSDWEEMVASRQASGPTDLPAVFVASALRINLTVGDLQVPLGAGDQLFRQHNTIVWQRADQTAPPRLRGGYPGYRRGQRVAVALLQSGNLVEVPGGLQLPAGGACAAGRTRPVRWLHDVTESSCWVELTWSQVRSQCVSTTGFLRLSTGGLPSILNASLDVRLAASGSSQIGQGGGWVDITDPPAGGGGCAAASSLRRVCPGAMVGYDITVVVRREGVIYNPQDTIVGVMREPLRRDLHFRGAEPDVPQRFNLVSRLRFVRQSLDATVEDTISPPLLPAVPGDVFYPFRLATERGRPDEDPATDWDL
eukprot:Hpha_TRINITY_DN16358_c0_g4::TRINITY_DN16358_c0_g4_i1::g.60275::m.60275